MTSEISLTKSTVPVAWLICAVLTVGGGFYWMADLNARVNSMEDVVRELVSQDNINANRLTRIETMVEGMSVDVGKIVDRIEEAAINKPSVDRP